MARFVASALGLAAVALADTPAPDAFVGLWSGTLYQGFGLANASDPGSWECLSSGQVLSASINANVTYNTLTTDDHPAVQSVFNNAIFTLPARNAQEYGWAAFQPDNGGATGTYNTQGILMLRPSQSPDFPVCKYARMSGSTVTIVTLGGYDWQAQCSSASYLSLSNLNTPLCTTNGQPLSEHRVQTRSPVTSTVVEIYTYQGTRSSGAESVGLGALAALAAAGTAYHAF